MQTAKQDAQGPQVRAEGWLPIKNTVFKTWRFARLHSSCCKTTPAIRSRAGVLRGAWHSEDWGWRAQRSLEQEVSKEVWKLLVTYLWEIQKEDMAGIGRHQAAKENRQRETSRPQLIQMPGLRSPVTSSASRETEAQKEGTRLLKMKAGLGRGWGKQWKACLYSQRTSKWSYQCGWVWGQPRISFEDGGIKNQWQCLFWSVPATFSPSPSHPCLPQGSPNTCCIRQTLHLLRPYTVGSPSRHRKDGGGDAQPVASGGRLHLCFCSSLGPISRDISASPHLSLGTGRASLWVQVYNGTKHHLQQRARTWRVLC